MKPVSYVGITGFKSSEEVSSALSEVERISPESNRKLMVGVLMSSKTLAGMSNKWPNRYPVKEELPSVFVQHPRALGLVHYNTADPDDLLGQMWNVAKLCSMKYPAMSGFQLNVAWPKPGILQMWRSSLNAFGNMGTIVLQIGHRAFEEVGHSPEQLAEKVATYADFIDYVLLDPSGGLGKLFDCPKALEYLRALRAAGLEDKIGFGVAGGLSAETIETIKPIVEEFPDISIDAEGKLRTTEDLLDAEKVNRYLQGAFSLLQPISV